MFTTTTKMALLRELVLISLERVFPVTSCVDVIVIVHVISVDRVYDVNRLNVIYSWSLEKEDLTVVSEHVTKYDVIRPIMSFLI